MSTMPEALPLAGLTQAEAEFVWNIEILGLPARKASQLAGMPYASMCKPHIVQARELAKRELRGSMQITKEDIVWHMTEAINRARLLGEPMTEIVGWEKVAKLLGFDAPQKIDVNITASIEALRANVRTMSDADLARVAQADGIIDADFYEAGAQAP